jgi:DNA-binding transcriptional LysR family regulator
VAVADCGSFTKAAGQLGVSTGSLSHTIRELEQSLGVRLLNRTTRSVAPTEAGERMLTRLRPLFDEFEVALDSVNAFRDRPAGQLRITVPPPVASFVLAPLLARFMEQYPEITIEVSADPELTDIVAGRYDAGIRLGHRVARDNRGTRYRRSALCCRCLTGLPAAASAPCKTAGPARAQLHPLALSQRRVCSVAVRH